MSSLLTRTTTVSFGVFSAVDSGSLTALVLGTMAGYGFSRFKFRGHRALSLFMLLGQLIPLIALIVPFFQIFDAVGLLDTKIGIALAHLTTALPLVTWIATFGLAISQGGAHLDFLVAIALGATVWPAYVFARKRWGGPKDATIAA